jgi:hypothetical protein
MIPCSRVMTLYLQVPCFPIFGSADYLEGAHAASLNLHDG